MGGGLSGLWAAVLAKQRWPERDVVVVEGGRLAGGASGRSGGFLEASLTHGLPNGLARFPDEIGELERLGLENLSAVRDLVAREEIDCGLELTGGLTAAVHEHEVRWLREEAEQLREHGHEAAFLNREQVQAEVSSPLFQAGLLDRTGAGLIDPARLAWGLARLARRLGVRIFEHSPVASLRRSGSGLRLRCASGELEANQVVLATAARRGLVGAVRRRLVPVWDYVLVSEPLSAEQLRSLGWAGRQGLSDPGNRFHYYRLTADDRILFGGYDAVYHYGNRTGPELEQSDEVSQRLASHFFALFPQLDGLRFAYRWGGAIDTCSRFFAFFGTAKGGDVAYSVGHTGLGIAASRFGAGVALDLLAGEDSRATRLRAVRSRPLPFPPEPLRWAAVQLTRSRLAAADRAAGRRGLWLRTLDRLGLGFDS